MLRNRKGFTLIELLIVVVIIGILAAIALPKFSSARERAYWSAMKSDLKSLSSSQEVYYAKWFQYTTALPTDFTASQSVTVTMVSGEDGDPAGQGWAASATHASVGTAKGCVIYNGTGVASGSLDAPGGTVATRAGVPFCDE